MNENHIDVISDRFLRLNLGQPRTVGSGTPLSATHFDILGLQYTYYWIAKSRDSLETITSPPTYPISNPVIFEYSGEMSNTNSRITLNNFPFCCKWKEETRDNLTQVFFLCKDEDGVKRVKEAIFTGAVTTDALPKLHNNFDPRAAHSDGDSHKFNNIALCGDWFKGGWTVDRVLHLKVSKNAPPELPQLDRPRAVLSKSELDMWYHVTNKRSDDAKNLHLGWDRILSSQMKRCHFHGTLPLKVCVVTSTLYEDKLPNFSIYPLGGVKEKYYYRIKIPVKEICSKLGHIFYWCGAISSRGVGQMYYICGGDEHVADIRKILAECVTEHRTHDVINPEIYEDPKMFNIIAVPK